VRIKIKGSHSLFAVIGLIALLTVFLWTAHWLVTCVGDHGELSFTEKRSFLGWGYTFGHTRALMWVEQGQTIDVRYQVRMAKNGRLSFRLRKLRPPWKLLQVPAWETVYVRSTQDGNFSLTATESGIHQLDRSESSVWEGSARLAWEVR
jgi:hypothetical protein